MFANWIQRHCDFRKTAVQRSAHHCPSIGNFHRCRSHKHPDQPVLTSQHLAPVWQPFA